MSSEIHDMHKGENRKTSEEKPCLFLKINF